MLLREVEQRDLETIRQWRNLPGIRKYMYTDHTISKEEHQRWFESISTGESSRYWIVQMDEEDVGTANLFDIDWTHQRCYWGFYLANPSVRGRGIGSMVEYTILKTVFDDMNLRKLCCEVLNFNEAVIRMHKRFGFKQEGVFRSHVLKGGEAFDVTCLAMLRDEWESSKGEIETALVERGLL